MFQFSVLSLTINYLNFIRNFEIRYHTVDFLYGKQTLFEKLSYLKKRK